MKDFLLVFRSEPMTEDRSPEEMQAGMKKWMDWIGGIAAQGKLTDRGNPLMPEGKTVKPGKLITDGPYTETKEVLGGYTIVKAGSLEEASKLADDCPIFDAPGGSVEVREVRGM